MSDANLGGIQVSGIQVCSLCSVKIQKLVGGDRVTFATGAASTRDVLWQRVCQHVQDRPGCINRNPRG